MLFNCRLLVILSLYTNRISVSYTPALYSNPLQLVQFFAADVVITADDNTSSSSIITTTVMIHYQCTHTQATSLPEFPLNKELYLVGEHAYICWQRGSIFGGRIGLYFLYYRSVVLAAQKSFRKRAQMEQRGFPACTDGYRRGGMGVWLHWVCWAYCGIAAEWLIYKIIIISLLWHYICNVSDYSSSVAKQ